MASFHRRCPPLHRFPPFIFLLMAVWISGGCQQFTLQSDFMNLLQQESSGEFRLTPSELRAYLNDISDAFEGMIEDGADDIIALAEAPEVKRHALLWKANAIPVLHEALFHSDPLVAIIDTKAFVLQMIQYFESGPGRTSFGPWHVTALAVCRDMDAILVEIGDRLVGEKKNRESLETLTAWVRENPITSPNFYRTSLSAEMASIIGEKSVNAFKAMGSLAIGMDDIAARMNVYARHLPKQARWQAELLISDELPPESARIVLGELMVLTDAARRAADVVAAGPDLIAAEREIILNRIEAERTHVLGALSSEHSLARTWLGGEREIVLAAVSEQVQRVEKNLGEMLAREREAVLSEAEAMRERLIVDAVEHTEAMVDRLLIKIGLMGLAGLLCIFGMLWLLLMRRRRPSAVKP